MSNYARNDIAKRTGMPQCPRMSTTKLKSAVDEASIEE